MAHSSPGQSRPLDSVDRFPTADSLSDPTKTFECHDEDPALLFEQQEPLDISQSPPKTNNKCHHDLPAEETDDYRDSHDSMLLEKPSSLSKHLDLGKGYAYGPAVQFAPGFFTSMPGKQAAKQAPIRQEAHSHYLDNPPSGPTRGAGSLRPSFSSIGSEPRASTSSNLLAVRSPDQAEPLTASHSPKVDGPNSSDKWGVRRDIPLMARAPPFSDTSPKELTRPFNQAPTVRVERNHPGVPDKEKATQISAPAKGSSSDAEAHRSPPAARNHDHAIPHFGSPSCNPQELLTDEAGKERRQPHPPLVPPTGGSRRFPGESADRTQNHMVNRPVKDIAHVGLTKAIHRVRPVSRSSNVSKQRSRCGSLASSPVIRQRRANISHEFTTGMAGVINQFTQQQSAALEEQKSKYHKYIKRLKRDLADGSGVIAQQISQIDSQASQINSLRDSQEHMMGQLKDIEAKLGASEDRGRKLEEKYRACKTHLNSAIKEQQDLYTRSKKHWGDTIEQVRAMEKSQSSETEAAVRKAEVIREQMMEKVRQIIAQNKSESSELYEQINSLKQQIEEKEAELGQERESVRSLSERLQDLRATSSGFEELALQGKEILRELGEQHAKAEEHRNKSAEELQKRLNVIATRLQTLSDSMSGQPDAMCGIREAQDESLNIVTAKLDSILESRVAAADAAGQLSADLELHTGKIWQRLDSHLESLSKQLAEKAEENGMVSTLYKRKDAECEEHLNELAMLRATTEKQADQIHELEASLVVSDAAQDQNEETIRRLDERATETERLREEVNSKTAAVAELQRRLDTKEAAFSSELQNCSSNIQKLANALQEKDQFLNTAAQQAAEAARQEMRHEMEKAHAKTEKSLQETMKDRDSLASQIEELKRQVQEKETSQSRDAATMRLLQENLALEEERGKLATEKFTQRLTDLEEVENKLTARLKALEIELKAASDRAVGLKAENQRQHTRSETLISGLKRWAQRAGLFANGLDNLGDSHENVEKITEILTRTLGPLSVRLDGRTGNPNVSLGDSLLGREDSKFFSSQNNQPIPEDLSTHTGIDPIMEGGKGDAMAKHLGTDDATEGTLDNDPLPYASRLHHMRRVVVRSPANVPNEPAAPSIDQEKMRRRGGTQPKSIMKRVTRSTSGMLRQGGNNTAANQGAFKRNRKDELSNGPALAHELEGIHGDTKAISAPEAEAAEDTSGAFPERPCKRRRSETARPDNSVTFKSAGQDRKGNSSRPVPISNVEAVDRKDEVSIVAQSKGRRQENQPNTSSSHDLLKPTSVRNSRTYSGSNSQGLHRVPSANTRRALGSRQTNVRTYGSQRAAGGHSTEGQYTESRFPLRPQPQSRYWPPKLKEEPQDSKTFSQGIVTNENLLVPFRN